MGFFNTHERPNTMNTNIQQNILFPVGTLYVLWSVAVHKKKMVRDSFANHLHLQGGNIKAFPDLSISRNPIKAQDRAKDETNVMRATSDNR